MDDQSLPKSPVYLDLNTAVYLTPYPSVGLRKNPSNSIKDQPLPKTPGKVTLCTHLSTIRDKWWFFLLTGVCVGGILIGLIVFAALSSKDTSQQGSIYMCVLQSREKFVADLTMIGRTLNFYSYPCFKLMSFICSLSYTYFLVYLVTVLYYRFLVGGICYLWWKNTFDFERTR